MLAPKSDVDPEAGNGPAGVHPVRPRLGLDGRSRRSSRRSPSRNTAPTSPRSSDADCADLGGLDALLLALLAFSLFVIVNALRFNPRRNAGILLLMLAPWVYIRVRDWLSVDPFRLAVWPMRSGVAVWLLRPGLRQLRLSAISSASWLSSPWPRGPDCRATRSFGMPPDAVITEEKNLLPWGDARGDLHPRQQPRPVPGSRHPDGRPHPRTAAARPAWLISMVALIWSAARSSIYSVVAMIVVVALLAQSREGGATARRTDPDRRLCHGGIVPLPPAIRSPSPTVASSGAPACSPGAAQPWFGYGSRYYTDLARTSGELGGTVYHGHNEVVQLLVIGGLVFAAMVAALVLTAIVRAARRSESSLYWFAFMFVLAGASCWRRPWCSATTDSCCRSWSCRWRP